jgi:hypothetical protein
MVARIGERAGDRQVGLGLRASVVDGGEEPRVQPGQPGQVLGIGSIVLAGVVVDQAELAGVGHQDLVAKAGKESADPTRVGAHLDGDAASWDAGELARQGGLGGGEARFFDQLAVLVQDDQMGVAISQIQPDEKHAILEHGRFLHFCTLECVEIVLILADEARW